MMISNVINNYFLEATLISIASWVYYTLLCKNTLNNNFNRYFILGSLVLTSLLPFIEIQSKSIIPVELSILLNPVFINSNSNSLMTISQVIMTIYLSGVLFSLLYFIINILKLIVLFNKYSDHRIKQDNYYILDTKGDLPIFSFFNFIFWNENQIHDEKEKQMVLNHEKTHVNELHSVDTIFISFLKIIFWFNPFIYLFSNEICKIHEFLADNKASSNNEKYIQLLINQTLFNMKQQWIHQFAKKGINLRIQNLNTQKGKSSYLAKLFLLPFLCSVFLITACNNDTETVLDNQNQDSSKIFEKPEVMPEFQGGMEGLIAYLSKEIKYPEIAEKEGIEGKTLVEFVIDENGSVKNAQILKGFDENCDSEALRVIKNMPNWKPGKVNKQEVSVKLILPISFKL